MRISDWSSDVCSSDLIVPDNPVAAMANGSTLAVIFFAVLVGAGVIAAGKEGEPLRRLLASGSDVMLRIVGFVMETAPFGVFAPIGRASCRERVCPDVLISVAAVSLKQTTKAY